MIQYLYQADILVNTSLHQINSIKIKYNIFNVFPFKLYFILIFNYRNYIIPIVCSLKVKKKIKRKNLLNMCLHMTKFIKLV